MDAKFYRPTASPMGSMTRVRLVIGKQISDSFGKPEQRKNIGAEARETCGQTMQFNMEDRRFAAWPVSAGGPLLPIVTPGERPLSR
jgi:hypothetical protein